MKSRFFLRKYASTLAITVAMAVLLPLQACAKEMEEQEKQEEPTGITMTTKAFEVSFIVAGAEDIAIDWGDGKKSDVNDASRNEDTGTFTFSCVYSGATEHNIVITGNVTKLDCYGSQLTALNVSGVTALTILYCYENQLTALDVSRNTVLTDLWCRNNQLTALDVSKNTALKELNCSYNKLTALDVSKNTVLKKIDCGNNQLTALDMRANTSLEDLHLCNTQIKNLDVSANTALNILCIRNLQFTASALNDLFRTLPYIPETKYAFIDIADNTGAFDCDRSIVEKKGWIINPLHWEPIHTGDEF